MQGVADACQSQIAQWMIDRLGVMAEPTAATAWQVAVLKHPRVSDLPAHAVMARLRRARRVLGLLAAHMLDADTPDAYWTSRKAEAPRAGRAALLALRAQYKQLTGGSDVLRVILPCAPHSDPCRTCPLSACNTRAELHCQQMKVSAANGFNGTDILNDYGWVLHMLDNVERAITWAKAHPGQAMMLACEAEHYENLDAQFGRLDSPPRTASTYVG